jgi:hypothetical protein
MFVEQLQGPKWFASVALCLLSLDFGHAIAAEHHPNAPDGFVVAGENGAWVFRRSGESDPETLIRVSGPVSSAGSPESVLQQWMATHGSGGAFSTPTSRPDLCLATRKIALRGHDYIEAVSAVRSQRGAIYVEQVFMLVDRPADQQLLARANGEIAGAIYRDEIPEAPQVTQPLAVRAPERMTERAGAPPGTGVAHSRASQSVSSIEAIAFDSVTHMGAGGFMSFDPTPMVLFKSGEAVDDMTALNAPEGLAAHQVAHPGKWLHWRRDGKFVEVDRKGSWVRLTYTKTLGAAPAGYRLDGTYQRLSGVGNIAVGGTSTVVAWSNFSFDHGGVFARGGGSSASSETAGDSGVRVVTTGRQPDEHGTYDITGYLLTLRFANGRVEQRAIVVDPAERDVIWLDGAGWTRP